MTYINDPFLTNLYPPVLTTIHASQFSIRTKTKPIRTGACTSTQGGMMKY